MSFGCDEAAQAPEGVFLKSMPHPRAYGNFAKLLGKYVREEKIVKPASTSTAETAAETPSQFRVTNLRAAYHAVCGRA